MANYEKYKEASVQGIRSKLSSELRGDDDGNLSKKSLSMALHKLTLEKIGNYQYLITSQHEWRLSLIPRAVSTEETRRNFKIADTSCEIPRQVAKN